MPRQAEMSFQMNYKDLKEKNLLNKEHCCYKTHISLMKSIDIPHFKKILPSFWFFKNFISL